MPRILCVDDDVSIRLLVKAVLERMLPAEVFVAGSGDEALAWLGTHPLPDLLLLDLMMPGMDGYEMFRRLRADARFAGLRVVFLSAQGSHDTTVHPEVIGVPMIEKPFVTRALTERVRRLLSETP